MRRIAAFSGNRAEYGLLFPIIRALRERPEFDVRLVVSGAHVQESFGRTIDEIHADGIEVAATVDLGITGDQPSDQARSLARGVAGFADVLDAVKPDIVLIYGDRMEGFAAAIAAFEMNLVIAHVEGGDRTEGRCHDDSARNAITKLAHLHFTTSADAAERVLRLGEEPHRVVFAGLPTLDSVTRKEFAPPEEIYREFDLDPTQPIVVFTQHPVTFEFERAGEQVRESLEALRAVGAPTVVTYPNSDPGSHAIIAAFEDYRDVPCFRFHKSLGRRNYLGLLNVAWAIVGNSSSGIKESPSFGIPCVDIGVRQHGRLRAANVIDVPNEREAIAAAVRLALYDEATRARARQCSNPYGEGRCGEIIAARLAEVPLDGSLLWKGITY